MERANLPAADGTAPRIRSLGPLWFLLHLGLIAWQGWMTLTLFGPEDPLARLTDGEPILSGRHPLHLYHGYLGAVSLRERARAVIGTPDKVKARLLEIRDAFSADELMVITITGDYDSRTRSYELLAEAFSLHNSSS